MPAFPAEAGNLHMQTIIQKKLRFPLNAILTVLVISVLFLRLSPHALAADTPVQSPIAEELSESGLLTAIPAESSVETDPPVETDDSPEIGLLSIRANIPSEFSGRICVELQNIDSGESVQMQLDPGHAVGQFLPVGVYTVSQAYIKNCDHFIVTCEAEIMISSCGNTDLLLTVTPDEVPDTYLEEREAMSDCPVSYADELLIWNYLMDMTGNAYGAAGIMGNLWAESGLLATNMEDCYGHSLEYDDLSYTMAVDEGTYPDFTGDGVGYGLAQWTYVTRKEKLYAFAIEQGTSIGDLEMQLRFLEQELSECGLLAAFENAGSIQKASGIMLVCFEAPTDQSDDVKKRRVQICQDFYNRFAPGEGENEVVQGQLDVIYAATHSVQCGIPEDVFCGQSWAAQVYAAAAFPLDNSCCAYHAALSNGVSSNWSKIPPGAAVYGYSGSEYGHVGIYVGDGLVYHSNGTVTVDTLTDWIETYQGFCWGWEAGIDLTQVP